MAERKCVHCCQSDGHDPRCIARCPCRRIWGLSFSEAFAMKPDLTQRSLYVEGWAIFEKTSLPGFDGRVAEFEPMRRLRAAFPNAHFFRERGPCDLVPGQWDRKSDEL